MPPADSLFHHTGCRRRWEFLAEQRLTMSVPVPGA
jgi:hypothetical protein